MTDHAPHGPQPAFGAATLLAPGIARAGSVGGG